eukprot:1692619-Amphidinium_carterae.1
MVAELALTMREMTAERETEENNVIENEKEDNENEMYNGENENNDEYDISEEEMQTFEHLRDGRRNTIDDGQVEHKAALPNTVRRSLSTIQ